MSIAKVKAQCGYAEKPPQRICSTCTHFTFEKVLSAWMLERNASGEGVMFGSNEPYTIEKNGIEKNLRCERHGFAVKKTAHCNDWSAKAP